MKLHPSVNCSMSFHTTVLWPLCSQPALVGTSSQELEDFVGAKFYCPYSLADSNQCTQIRKKHWNSPQQCYLHSLHTVVFVVP